MSRKLFILAVALGLSLRLLIAWFSIGSNDAAFWLQFAESIQKDGLIQLYRTQPLFNHPPLPGYGAWMAAEVSAATGLSFWFLFKLPVIAADGLTCWLLWRIGGGAIWGRWAAVAFAWNLDAILVSGYHCNTDPIYAALALLSAWFIVERRNFLAAGLALAAAINVKIIPVLLIPALASQCATWKEFKQLLAGLAVGVVPFLPVLAMAGSSFVHNALGYNSSLDRWGVSYFLADELMWGDQTHHPKIVAEAARELEVYHAAARYLILGSATLLGFASWRLRGRWNAYQLVAVVFALFLVLTPGFGVQYTAAAGPALFAASLRRGILYGLLAGLFLLLVYWATWTGEFPPFSYFKTFFPTHAALFGLLAWWTLAKFAARSLMDDTRPARLDSDGSIKG